MSTRKKTTTPTPKKTQKKAPTKKTTTKKEPSKLDLEGVYGDVGKKAPDKKAVTKKTAAKKAPPKRVAKKKEPTREPEAVHVSKAGKNQVETRIQNRRRN
jgi:hypothetical protein